MWSAAQQTTDRSSCLCGGKKKKRGGANSVFQTERSSWNPSLSLIAGAHTLPANASLIKCGAWSHFTANKQRMRLWADAAWGGAEAVRLPLRLIRDSIRMVCEGGVQSFSFSFSSTFSSLFFMSPLRPACHFYDQLYCVTAPVITCHSCPVKDRMTRWFIIDIKQGVLPSKTLRIVASVSCDAGGAWYSSLLTQSCELWVAKASRGHELANWQVS